jgi:DNA-binding response OmpR family regulator
VKRILIVDDDARIVDRLAMLLGTRYEAVVASNGFDALAQLDGQAFDVVLLDLRMPGLDGAGFVQELKARRMNVPIILISANPNLPAQAKALGISHYLPKPFDIERLEAMVETL